MVGVGGMLMGLAMTIGAAVLQFCSSAVRVACRAPDRCSSALDYLSPAEDETLHTDTDTEIAA